MFQNVSNKKNVDFLLHHGKTEVNRSQPEIWQWVKKICFCSIFSLLKPYWTSESQEFYVVSMDGPVEKPRSGREFRHSISTELSPGEYTLLFVLEMPTGAAMGAAMGQNMGHHGRFWAIERCWNTGIRAVRVSRKQKWHLVVGFNYSAFFGMQKSVISIYAMSNVPGTQRDQWNWHQRIKSFRRVSGEIGPNKRRSQNFTTIVWL